MYHVTVRCLGAARGGLLGRLGAPSITCSPCCLPCLSIPPPPLSSPLQIVPTLYEPLRGKLIDSHQFSASDFVNEFPVSD
jgi:hypothetical protein